jgi:purine-nucleoside phosphorylase
MIDNITKQIKNKIGNFTPKTTIILGSGLGKLADDVKNPIIINYNEIEDFPQSTVKGHKGRFIIGYLENEPVIIMQGRIHLYEGHSPEKINIIIRVLKKLGVKNLFLTNAAGSLNTNIPQGSLMLIKDHINFSGINPLIGPNDDDFGPRFPDMSDAYNKEKREKIKEIASDENIPLKEGVYLMVTGPNYETAAEIKTFKFMGADAVGMSTVPETISAIHSGMKVNAISVITNMATGIANKKHDHEDVLKQGEIATTNLTKLLKAYYKGA